MRFAISTIVIGFVLFLYSGISQNFPWGVPTAQIVTEAIAPPEIFSSNATARKFAPRELTTEAFDEVFTGRISTLTTDRSFSWVISTGIENYKPSTYLTREFLNQLMVGFFLTVTLSLTRELPTQRRYLVILFVGLAGLAATFVQQMNWWHVPLGYQLGMMLNISLSWTISVVISATWIIKADKMNDAQTSKA